MLNGPIAIKMLWFALPVAGTAFLQQLLNAADVAVVGRYASSHALAAVGANAFVINLMINLFVGLSVGANVVIARYLGEQDEQRVHEAVHTSIALSLLSGLFLSIVGWFGAEYILALLDTPMEIMSLAVRYFRIYFLGMPFLMVVNFSAAVLRSKGDTRRPLFVMAISGVVNVLLNLVFVIHFHMTVEGVALATLASSMLSAMMLIRILCKERSSLQLHLRKIRIHRHMLMSMASIGIPAGIQGMLFNFSNVLIQSGINSLGATAIAANTISLNFDYFCFFVANAFAQAGTSFLSQNHGAKQHDRCNRIIRDTILLGAGATMLVSFTFVFLAQPLAQLFTSDGEVLSLTVQRMAIVLSFYTIHSCNESLSGLLRALGHSLAPALVCVVFVCGLRLLWLYLIFPTNRSLAFLSCCYPVSWVVNATVLFCVFFWMYIPYRKLSHR
ncbi:MAG: MATE family efflux transporter [Bacteroidaceae bacterium]|nr:MATE family efflux transporter [Bacteroidaceae bacterium]